MKKTLKLFLLCLTCCSICFLLIIQLTRKTASSAVENRQKSVSDTAVSLLKQYQPLKNATVILDPGHGGNDPGMVLEDLYEKDVNLQLCEKIRNFLTDWGCTVLTTRDDDTYVSLEDRVQMTKDHKADLFISIHLNALDHDTTLSGIETYYNTSSSSDSKLLAEAVQAALINETGANDRAARGDSNLYVVRMPRIPSCLVEAGYLTSDTERPLLLSDDYQEKLAEGIAKGILQFTSLKKTPEQKT
ncbi:MAG: N-acetylmuramoyl-L-alanine amidase [Lachnospiraceae bacterium]|nr:N-acetylmuramoyl-L-alanine amidase [Lachnospiraceae bacterium]